jgi:tRNA (adenine57-N1/adenine58-N1)-methyltransferase
MAHPSPFFYPPPTSEQDSLAILHLKRDSLLPVKLRATADDGYAEGAVTNTRFGSFPHRTLIGLEWGSQVRASKVDTGSRGRKGKKVKQDETQSQAPREEDKLALANEPSSNKKRKSDDAQQENGAASPVKKRKPDGIDETHLPSAPAVPLEAGSGFIHILPPTPEAWTSSLDHRTQVVYTPDYSYILQRLRVRPGNTIIEAGAGSGSFTHAASRAIFNGYPDSTKASQKMGRVCSFEYHEPRVQTLRQEISDHGLDGIVELTHRDVCNDGFLLSDGTSPQTDAIFLDLPAPWTALKHLTRSEPNSPLNPHNPVHLCSFSPCIEQVIATVTALRKAGWADISMVEVQHKRIDVRRERVGLKEEGLRGVNAVAASVEESIDRLR